MKEYDEIRSFIEDYYATKPEFLMTVKKIDTISSAIFNAISLGDISSDRNNKDEIIEKLNHKVIISFINNNNPYLVKPEQSVVDSIIRYFNDNLPQYVPIEVCRSSNNSALENSYSIIAEDSNGLYACWTNWNQVLESVDYGHYNLSTKEEGMQYIRNAFYDITGEIDKYGPEETMIQINQDKQLIQNVSEQETNIRLKGNRR